MNTQSETDLDEDFESEEETDEKYHRKIIETTHDLKRLNDQMGLTAMAKFGWLRSREIGNVLWPRNPTRNVAGARIARRWKSEKLVIEKKLPDGFGSAFLLSKKGAEFVDSETEYGEDHDVTSGKKIGDHITDQVEGIWIPSRSWRHDLLTNGFLTLVMGFGGDVVTELELRREHPGSKKIYDGLYRTDEAVVSGGSGWIAVETERTGKWANNARALARSLVDSQVYGCNLGQYQIDATVLIYEDPSRNHYGSADRVIHDHFERVSRQVRSMVPVGESINLIGIPLHTTGGGVVDVGQLRHLRVDFQHAAVIDRSVLGHRWEGSGRQLALHKYLGVGCPFAVELEEDSEGDLVVRISRTAGGERRILVEKETHTKIEVTAQRLAIRELKACNEYRGWATSHLDRLSKV